MAAADLRSVAKLGELEQALARFRATAKEVCDEVSAEGRRQLAIIERCRQEAHAEVRRREAELHGSGEKNRRGAEAEVETAKSRLRWVEDQQRKALDAERRYRAAVPRFEEITNEHIPKSCQVLREKGRAAEAYLAVQLQGDLLSGASVLPVTSSSRDAYPASAASMSIAGSALPTGFAWVSLANIDPSSGLGRDRVRATSAKSDLRRAFEALQQDILPALERKAAALTAEGSRDAAHDVTGENHDSHAAYAVFFGNDSIELCGPDSQGRFSAARGWDQIETAIDLDWLAVPARVRPYADVECYRGSDRDLEACKGLSELLTRPNWPAEPRTVDLWIGESATVDGDEMNLRLPNQGESNLLIITENHRQAAGLISACFLSLAGGLSPADAKFFVIDMAKGNVEWDEARGQCLNLLPHSLEVYSNDDANRLLEKLAAEIERRAADRQGRGRWLGYLFIVDPMPVDVFSIRVEESGYGYSGDVLQTIVLKGPAVGIHTVVWCDTAKILKRPLGRDQVQAFRYRLIGRTDGDQEFVLPLRAAMLRAEHLGAMVLDDRDSPTAQTMFYPYRAPAADWLETVTNSWKNRTTGDSV